MIKITENKKNLIERDSPIQIYFSKEEKENLKKFSKESGYSSISEFVRQSVFDKIRALEHPEVYATLDNDLLVKLLHNQEKTNEELRLMNENTSLVKDVQNILEMLNKLVKRPDIEASEKLVIEVLKEHKTLKIKRISELTKLEINLIYDVISNTKLFSIDVKTGGIKLNE